MMHIPANIFDCENLFGELYLYMSCSDKCGNHAPCPLTRPVLHDSCPGQYLDRTYTVVNNNYLTFLVKSQGSYNNDLFVCENNHCLPYQKVCDLVDDCGDGSDELSTQIISNVVENAASSRKLSNVMGFLIVWTSPMNVMIVVENIL